MPLKKKRARVAWPFLCISQTTMSDAWWSNLELVELFHTCLRRMAMLKDTLDQLKRDLDTCEQLLLQVQASSGPMLLSAMEPLDLERVRRRYDRQ